jgi:2-haloacid dehalogenase
VAASRQVDAVIFDVGHVLYDWDPRYLYAKLIPDPDRLDWFLDNVVTKSWHYQHDMGRPFAETGPELIAQYPEEADLIALYGPRWLETIGDPMPGMMDLVRRIDEAGLPLFGITNFSAEFWTMFRPTAPIFDRFLDIIVSGAERMMKPDPAIYALAERRFAVDPPRALFIDDQPRNIAAAKAHGFHAHRFEGRDSLDARLETLGLAL